ncbi:MAG: ATP-binding protein, partial [Candidatus Omnitrophica bacterium]|nr:ATP-binding protein [Candidatus Omnitrophota bacterium]
GEKLDQSWVGRTVDQGFISDLEKVSGVDLCGEMGEFHSFVYDGPIFSKKINIVKTEKLLIKGYWFLDLKEYTFEKKGE